MGFDESLENYVRLAVFVMVKNHGFRTDKASCLV